MLKQEESWPVYLRVYRTPRTQNAFVDQWFRMFSFHSHCSLRVGDIVIHFWDDLKLPQWVREDVDRRHSSFKKEILIGYTNKSLSNIRDYTNQLKPMSRIDFFCRVMWVVMYFFWWKRNDCVHKCSQTLHWMGFNKTIYTVPDELYKLYL